MPKIGEIQRADYGRDVKIWDGNEWVKYVPNKDILVKDILENLEKAEDVYKLVEENIKHNIENKDYPDNRRFLTTSTAFHSAANFMPIGRTEDENRRKARQLGL